MNTTTDTQAQEINATAEARAMSNEDLFGDILAQIRAIESIAAVDEIVMMDRQPGIKDSSIEYHFEIIGRSADRLGWLVAEAENRLPARGADARTPITRDQDAALAEAILAMLREIRGIEDPEVKDRLRAAWKVLGEKINACVSTTAVQEVGLRVIDAA